jgi:hypothetical protein
MLLNIERIYGNGRLDRSATSCTGISITGKATTMVETADIESMAQSIS